MKKTTLISTLIVVLALLSACAPAATEEAILTVGENTYTQSSLEALGLLSVDYTDKDGATTTYEGVLLSGLLEDAGLVEGGSEVVFTAADGYEASMTLEEALACANCIIAFDDDSLRTVMPDMSGKLQVKDVVEVGLQ